MTWVWASDSGRSSQIFHFLILSLTWLIRGWIPSIVDFIYLLHISCILR